MFAYPNSLENKSYSLLPVCLVNTSSPASSLVVSLKPPPPTHTHSVHTALNILPYHLLFPLHAFTPFYPGMQVSISQDPAQATSPSQGFVSSFLAHLPPS